MIYLLNLRIYSSNISKLELKAWYINYRKNVINRSLNWSGSKRRMINSTRGRYTNKLIVSKILRREDSIIFLENLLIIKILQKENIILNRYLLKNILNLLGKLVINFHLQIKLFVKVNSYKKEEELLILIGRYVLKNFRSIILVNGSSYIDWLDFLNRWKNWEVSIKNKMK